LGSLAVRVPVEKLPWVTVEEIIALIPGPDPALVASQVKKTFAARTSENAKTIERTARAEKRHVFVFMFLFLIGDAPAPGRE
jgi:hypothetical protein